MTENVTMNTETNTSPTKNHESDSAFEKILLFPFRLIGSVFKYTTRIISIILFVGMIAIAIRSAFPMNLPEARGMTYYQFMYHRWTSALDWVKADVEANGDPEYKVYKRMGFMVGLYALVPYGYLGVSLTFIVNELIDNEKFDHWARTEIDPTNQHHSYLPSYQVTWQNLPKSLWDAWEKTSWLTLVTKYNKTPHTYPDTAN